MSRSCMHPRAMLAATVLSALLLTTACSDAVAPSNDEGSIVAAPPTGTRSGGPTATTVIARPPASGEVEDTSKAGGPSFSYASATLPNIRGCFTYSAGAAYRGMTVYLLYWTGTAWDYVRNSSGTVRSRPTDANGCIQFDDVPVNKYLALYAYTVFNFPTCQIWSGMSKYIGPTAKNDVLWRTGYTTVSMIAQGYPNNFSQACLNM